MLTEACLVVLALFLGLYWYVTKNFGYFAKHGVAEEPGSFPFGSNSEWRCFMKGEIFDEKHKNERMHGMLRASMRA